MGGIGLASRTAVGPVFHIIGLLLTILGFGMLVPAAVDAASRNVDWQAFIGASAATLVVSGGMVLATSGRIERFSVKQTFLLTTLAWIILATFGALPFMLSALGMSVTDSFYEAMSGLSTTGGTVIIGLDTAPPGVLLWRALLNWFGGVGIIVMAIAILPVLRSGGMQLFRTESSDKGDKPFATVQDTAGAIAVTYLILSLISAVLYRAAGMSWFDAICHAMAAVSTGGFSTKDASIGYYQSHAIIWVTTFSMMLGALPLTYYIRLLRNFRGAIFSDSQVVTLIIILVASITAMTAWTILVVHLPPWEAFTQSAMNVTSIITDCGLVSTDYGQWGTFAVAAFFFFYFIGGCTGSTSGSIKVFRWQILFCAMGIQMARMLQPHRVVLPVYHGKAVDQDVIESVINLVVAYIVSFAALSLALACMNLDFLTSASAVASALAGAGPGLGPIVGPSGNYATVPDAAKWVLSAAMLIGRLEVFTVLVLFSRAFWRD